MDMAKKLLRWFSVNSSVRRLVRMVNGLLDVCLRIWSRLRFGSLVENSHSSICHWSTEIKSPENIHIGNHVIIGPHCCLGAMADITIGDYTRISRGVVIETAGLDLESDLPYSHVAKPITIGR